MNHALKFVIVVVALCSIPVQAQVLPPSQTITIEEGESIAVERVGPTAESVEVLGQEVLPSLIDVRHDFLDLTMATAESL